MTNLYVGNLSYQTTDSDLSTAFSEFGPVEKASVVRDRDSGQSRGFGFVEMSNASDAARAINALNGQDLNGRALNINEARPRESGGQQNRPRNGGGGGGGGRRREPRW